MYNNVVTCVYFQEELAFMFEMLSLYEDALVQYDELDALFTQFVLNHAAGGEKISIMDTVSKTDMKMYFQKSNIRSISM